MVQNKKMVTISITLSNGAFLLSLSKIISSFADWSEISSTVTAALRDAARFDVVATDLVVHASFGEQNVPSNS